MCSKLNLLSKKIHGQCLKYSNFFLRTYNIKELNVFATLFAIYLFDRVFLEWIIQKFWIYNIFFVSQQKKHFLWRVHLDKTTLTRNNLENWVLIVSPTEIYSIFITRTDFDHYFSELFLVRFVLSRWTFHKKCFFCRDTKKNVKYSKLVNYFFKWESHLTSLLY